ncbi:MAG: hypothetical protein JRC60_00310 [Deltaproteobacteria bacterium]|nr:hypothetical protein [Deltaproteobacteria bacterium]
MRKITIILTILIFSFTTLSAQAFNASVETGKSKKVIKEKSQTGKTSEEKKETTGKKKSESKTTGRDLQTSDVIKAVKNAMANRSMDITVNLETLFLDRIAELEEGGIEPFCRCRVVTAPKLARDFGLSAEISPGIIDLVRANWLAKAAQSNMSMATVGTGPERAISEYMACIIIYGAIIGQAYINLNEDMNKLDLQTSPDGTGTTTVSGIGYDDLVKLARGALDRVLKNGTGDIANPVIQRLALRAIKWRPEIPYQLDGSLEKIRHGSTQITLGAKPAMIISGVQWYGQAYAGMSGTYKVSAGWSWSDAIEKLKTTSEYSKAAEQISEYSDELASKGNSTEAVLVKKRAFDLVKSGKQSASVMKLLPGL